jgi:copper chaperone CopZ
VILRLTVAGMHAVHARRAVETALAGVSGVRALDVTLGTVEVELEEGADADAVSSAITGAGFEVVSVTREPRRLRILGPDADAREGA